jgi:carboxyl-terminal processing protease
MKYQREAFERDEQEGENISHKAEKDSTRQQFKTMGGRIVYGGGGITPDYIVKSDRLNEYSVQLRSKLVFLQAADKYLDQHGAELRANYGKDSRRFVEESDVTPQMLEDLKEIAKAKGIAFNQELFDKDLRYVKAFTKAYVARGIWGNEGSVQVMLKEDAQFKKAVSLFPEAEKIAKAMTSGQ